MKLLLVLLASDDLWSAAPPKLATTAGWIEISAAGSWEKFFDGHAVRGIPYEKAFWHGAAVDAQAGYSFAWNARSSWWPFDLMIRPHVGFSYRAFHGESLVESGQAYDFSDLTVEVVYAGLTLGLGNLMDAEPPILMTFLTLQAGSAYMSSVSVEAPGLFAGFQEVFKNSRLLYLAAGAGVEVQLGAVDLRFEVGIRDLGYPSRGDAPLSIPQDQFLVLYVLLGIGVRF